MANGEWRNPVKFRWQFSGLGFCFVAPIRAERAQTNPSMYAFDDFDIQWNDGNGSAHNAKWWLGNPLTHSSVWRRLGIDVSRIAKLLNWSRQVVETRVFPAGINSVSRSNPIRHFRDATKLIRATCEVSHWKRSRIRIRCCRRWGVCATITNWRNCSLCITSKCEDFFFFFNLIFVIFLLFSPNECQCAISETPQNWSALFNLQSYHS